MTKFLIDRRFANICTCIYQDMLDRFSQSFHRIIAICVQMIDVALCTVGVENFSRVPTGSFT